MGRQNFGCDTGNWDWKGLTSQNVTLNGKRLRGWEVFPLQLDDVSDLAYASGQSGAALVSAARRRMLEVPAVGGKRNADAPAFFRRGICGVWGAGGRILAVVWLCCSGMKQLLGLGTSWSCQMQPYGSVSLLAVPAHSTTPPVPQPSTHTSLHTLQGHV
jgi:hypothetical protein